MKGSQVGCRCDLRELAGVGTDGHEKAGTGELWPRWLHQSGPTYTALSQTGIVLLESGAPPRKPLSPPTPLWVTQHLNFAFLLCGSFPIAWF